MGRPSLDREKVTLSLPRDLVRYADALATELATSRSQVIADALAERRAREEDELAREGYAFYAQQSEEFAAAVIASFSEVLRDGG
ncbi:MAG TPA: hypothetical protein VK821_16395 [Dehalococcoidia bacterium]|nr:hypothetical protein [Dehalococcoidia bacterium]